ncbi:putative signal-recognition-particle GTPase [Helianthus annuus]|nr:putative signal-recognition-particle GTPase [Helianthus annuus]
MGYFDISVDHVHGQFAQRMVFVILQKPHLVIFVMDSSIDQAAFDKAKAFKRSVVVGAFIGTKMDGHEKGGGNCQTL